MVRPENRLYLFYANKTVVSHAAICTYLLITIVRNDMKLERSTYEVLQILSISLTDKTHLKDLFDKTKFQYDKDTILATIDLIATSPFAENIKQNLKAYLEYEA